MNIFQTISDGLARLLKGQKKPDGVDKSDILQLIDNNLILLKTVINTFDSNPEVIKFIQSKLTSVGSKDNTILNSLYFEYTKELAYLGKNAEKNSIFSSIRQTAAICLLDHQKIRDNFATLFNQGTDASEIQLEQMKLSHAAVFGFINLSTLLCDWFCYFYTSVVGQPGEVLRVPAYRDQMIKTSSKTVAAFVNDTLVRGTRKSILDIISDIRKNGDVTIYSDAATLDTYANVNDYPGATEFFGGFAGFISDAVGLLFNSMHPILFLRELFTQMNHNKYKRNLALREWMITKTAVLQMDLNNISQDAPEYQRQLSILNKYSDEIAKLDKVISQYENS